MNENIEKIINIEDMKINIDNLNEKQKRILHLVDNRFFKNNINPYRQNKLKEDCLYITPINLDKDLFYMHSFLDPMVLEQGNVRRFPASINKKYISEKYFEDKWVSEGNNELAIALEKYISNNLDQFKKKETIKLLDIGPCGGAITTLFALKALAKYNLLDKIEIYLLDIVPNVLEATILGEFNIPNELIKEYHLEYAGKDGEKYKELLKQGKLYGVKEWYNKKENPHTEFTQKALLINNKNIITKYFRGDGEKLPEEIKEMDIVLSGYVHHHMNMIGRKLLCEQMEITSKKGGFIGIIDFYVKDYEAYMKWYKPHFEKYNDAPPVECPVIGIETLDSFFKKTNIYEKNNKLENSMLLCGIKEE
jgi:hypothetical protein